MKDSLEIVIAQVCLEGSLKRGGRISGGVFEAHCSKQIGQCNKTVLTPKVFMFTRGVTNVQVSDTDCNRLVGV